MPDLVVLEFLSWSMFLFLWDEFRGKIKNSLHQVHDRLENNGIPNGVSFMPTDKTSSTQDACLGGPFDKINPVLVVIRAFSITPSYRAQVISRCRGMEIIIAKAVDSPSEATGMTGVILAMSRLKDFVNGFVNLKSIRSIDTKDSMRTHQPTQLSKNMKTKENEKRTIARFLGSLRTDISDVVYFQQYYSFHDVYRLALKVEKQLSTKQKTTTRFSSSSHAPQSATSPVRVGPIKADPQALIGVSPTSTTSSLCCFNCQRIGHLKRGCLNKQVLTLIDEADPLYDTKDEVETKVVYPDWGELLVTHRLLKTIVLDQDDDTTWLRTNIFHTQCVTKGKICTVIIDGGSCENMVSTTMVEKLENPVISAAPLSTVPLLKEFKYVFPEEIPAGLPMILSAEGDERAHQIKELHAQAEFAYNRSNHNSTGRSPFFIVYGCNPFTPLDLAPMVGDGSVSAEGDERAHQIKELHAQVREQIIKHNLQYQTCANKHHKQVLFEEGDLVWIHLRRAQFPQRRFGHYGVSDTFNVADLSPYTPNADFDDDSGSSHFFRGGR
nr:reverse transcriptase domain-containing protein [Tanacetum cinerariifolium]